VGEEQSLRQTVNKKADQRQARDRNHSTRPTTLERVKPVTVAVLWKAPLERGRGPLLMQERWQLQKAGRAVYWRKEKGHASRRTLNKQSLKQQMAVSRRQVSHSLKQTFKAVSRLPPFFFSSFDETTPDAEGLTEPVLHLNLGYFCFCCCCCCFGFFPL
jgi:hypothetical protein